jgi:phthiodiolone/phenolphthiodiolone dimycocerosates ketoreductase
MPQPFETAIPFADNRAVPLQAIGPFVKVMGDTGVVDSFWTWDELTSWFPKNLWTSENTGWADALPLDSTHDPFIQAAVAATQNPELSLHLSTDAIRARPAELMRTLMSLAGATNRRTVLGLGAGELRQTRPFGYKRKEGLSRLEDVLRLTQLLWERDAPFSFEGNHWRFENAYLGGVRPERKPEIWALGGGPKLMELAAKYADGFETNTPPSAVNPELWATWVTNIKQQLEAGGRDPEEFGFGLWFATAMHEDREVIEHALDNPILKFFAPLFGRTKQTSWRKEGVEPVMPDNYLYALHFAPFDMTAEEANSIVERVPRKMVERAMHIGTPAECAAIAQGFIDAGATFIGVVDVLPLIWGPEKAEEAMGRSIEFCRILKERNG